MRDDEYLEFTAEGFQKFADALTDYPEEMRVSLASMVAMKFM